MEEGLYSRLQATCQRIAERKTDRIYLYPFGNRGMQIFAFLKEQYGFQDIVPVDDGLCRYNPRVISFAKMENMRKTDNSVLIVTSDNPAIYRELRLKVYRAVDREQVEDCFGEHPWTRAKDQRLAALAIASGQIYMNQVEGCAAEAGVYQGEFARHMNVLFPDRKLYLFDTFHGFDPGQVDAGADNTGQTDQWINGLKDTTEGTVMEKMRYKHKVTIRKGLFPETARGIDERFAFVNLDMDLYKPTYEGLLFFWERMSPGGYMFVHDIDNWDGIRAAVTQFCEKRHAAYMCLNDGITACIPKPLGWRARL